jgi:hypothetical protein
VAAVNYEDGDAGLCYLVQEWDLQGPGSSWIVLEGGDGWSGGGRNGRMTRKKAKLGGITPSRWCQQSMNNRQTRILSQIIQTYGEFSLEMPISGGFRKSALLQSLFVKLVIYEL